MIKRLHRRPLWWALGAIGSLAAVIVATPAAAATIELGQTPTPLAPPQCPKGQSLANCRIVLAHTTAIDTTSDGVLSPVKVTRSGWIVGFSVGVSQLVADARTELKIIHAEDETWGGTPRVQITVLRPSGLNAYAVAAQSAPLHLIPFLGEVVSEPLSLPPSFSTLGALAVKRGDVIGLTVPTWAPVLAYELAPTKFAYRQSRRTNCTKTPATQTAQLTIGESTPYLCSYTGARIEYSATEITNTPYPRKYVH